MELAEGGLMMMGFFFFFSLHMYVSGPSHAITRSRHELSFGGLGLVLGLGVLHVHVCMYVLNLQRDRGVVE